MLCCLPWQHKFSATAWEQQSPAKEILGQLPRKEKSFHALHWTAWVTGTNRSLQVRCLFGRETSFLLYVGLSAGCCKCDGGTHNRIPLRSFHYTPTRQQKLLYSSLNTHISHCLSACLFTDKSITGAPCHNHCDWGPLSLLTWYRSTQEGCWTCEGSVSTGTLPHTPCSKLYYHRTHKRHSPISIQVDQGVTPQWQHQAHRTSATAVRKRKSVYLLQLLF